MSTLVVIGYDDPFKAQEVRLTLAKLQKDYLIDLEDAVVAVKDDKGKVKLHQAVNLTAAGPITVDRTTTTEQAGVPLPREPLLGLPWALPPVLLWGRQ